MGGCVREEVERTWEALRRRRRRRLLLLLVLLLRYRNLLGRPRTQVMYGRVAGLLRKQIRIDEVRDSGRDLRSTLCLCSIRARRSVGYMVPIRIVLVLIQVYQFLMSDQEVAKKFNMSVPVRDALGESGGGGRGRVTVARRSCRRGIGRASLSCGCARGAGRARAGGSASGSSGRGVSLPFAWGWRRGRRRGGGFGWRCRRLGAASWRWEGVSQARLGVMRMMVCGTLLVLVVGGWEVMMDGG